MKMYAVYATTSDQAQNPILGYLGIDLQSGGYPYCRDTASGPEFFRKIDAPQHTMDNILKNEDAIGELTNGGTYVTRDASVFLHAYYEQTKCKKNQPFQLMFRLVEYDYTNPLKVKATVLRRINVSGRTIDSYKSEPNSYYNAEELRTDQTTRP